jgi:hypothetical protein
VALRADGGTHAHHHRVDHVIQLKSVSEAPFVRKLGFVRPQDLERVRR